MMPIFKVMCQSILGTRLQRICTGLIDGIVCMPVKGRLNTHEGMVALERSGAFKTWVNSQVRVVFGFI